jgi:hypothetical protein
VTENRHQGHGNAERELEDTAMLLQRDLLVVAVSIAIAAALYFLTFRDLAIADPAALGTDFGATPAALSRAPLPTPTLAG